MNHEQVALVALLRTRPGRLTWPQITEEVLACGSAVAVWERYNPEQLIPSPTATAALSEAESDLQRWEREQLCFISVLDKEFPHRLLDIVETPPFLFAQGAIHAEDHGVSVVGSRKASARGLEMASGISRFLVHRGLSVISGLAAGIDTAAHTAALNAGGRTVAFLGTGCGISYPPKNRDLQAAIADRGLVLSQFWPEK
ncbi:DNA-processing protein DprA [Mycobacterium sp. MBM]|nr:DNA-processing protein DprA [Mycobacterium sp. MBM]